MKVGRRKHRRGNARCDWFPCPFFHFLHFLLLLIFLLLPILPFIPIFLLKVHIGRWA
jgi:hypothetical protein